MLIIATQRHDGQFDKGGAPYILHPLKVMHYLRSDDPELQCIALGHDLIEDTFKDQRDGEGYLRSRGFSERVIDGILALTKREGQTLEQYKAQVMANKDAIKVKMADLRHNSDIRRLKGVTAKDFDRMAKYHQFYLELKEVGKYD
jgi:(p)ppGpp synthase/HD superfamily hydrolase